MLMVSIIGVRLELVSFLDELFSLLWCPALTTVVFFCEDVKCGPYTDDDDVDDNDDNPRALFRKMEHENQGFSTGSEDGLPADSAAAAFFRFL